MKKKIMVASLFINLIAGVFVFMAFKEKAKNVNDGGAPYISINIGGGDISVSDGNSILEQNDLKTNIPMSTKENRENNRENNQRIAKVLNQWKAKGYELITANFGEGTTHYIMVKK